eukprot:10804457-Alexandrium_andersonii.AAC.1
MGVTHIRPPSSTVLAGRLDARMRGLAKLRVQLRTQHIPAESVKRWGALSPAVLPMQIDELK